MSLSFQISQLILINTLACYYGLIWFVIFLALSLRNSVYNIAAAANWRTYSNDDPDFQPCIKKINVGRADGFQNIVKG